VLYCPEQTSLSVIRERHQISPKFLISPTAISRQGGSALLWKHMEIYSDIGNSVLRKTDAFVLHSVSTVKHFQFVKVLSFWKHVY
jgi:hypothetical protein